VAEVGVAEVTDAGRDPLSLDPIARSGLGEPGDPPHLVIGHEVLAQRLGDPARRAGHEDLLSLEHLPSNGQADKPATRSSSIVRLAHSSCSVVSLRIPARTWNCSRSSPGTARPSSSLAEGPWIRARSSSL